MRRVLVVDDDSSVRRVMAQMLEALGYGVVTARNGLDALNLFCWEGEEIDLVVTDLRMPVMDGYEAVDRMRKLSPDVRIICMSSDLARACPAGAPAFSLAATSAQARAESHRASRASRSSAGWPAARPAGRRSAGPAASRPRPQPAARGAGRSR